MFLQREKQLEKLNNSYNQPHSTIDFIFGKRNTGKTALLNEFTKDKDKIFISNYEMIPSHFFTTLANIINNYFERKDLKVTFSSFLEVLEFLSKQEFDKKLVVIFDNFQNITNIDKNALDTLLSIWKKTLKNKNLHLIVLSSNFYAEKSMLDVKKTAFNYIELNYLNFNALMRFFPNLKKLDQLYVYSLLGTTTTNLKYYNSQKSFSENIYNLFLSPNAYLANYGMRVLKQDISDIGTYASILYVISQGNTKIGDIAKALDVKSTYLSRYMQKLVDVMLIKKIVPLGDDAKKSKFGRYIIEDNALNFWFSYIYPNLSKLQFMNVDEVSKLIEEEFISKIVFKSYKECIKEYIYQNQEEILSFEATFIGSWWDNNDTIDLVAYNNKTITFIQILWEENDNSSLEKNKLISISNKFNTTLDKKYLIISKDVFLKI